MAAILFGDGERELAAGASQGRKGASQAERQGKGKAARDHELTGQARESSHLLSNQPPTGSPAIAPWGSAGPIASAVVAAVGGAALASVSFGAFGGERKGLGGTGGGRR